MLFEKCPQCCKENWFSFNDCFDGEDETITRTYVCDSCNRLVYTESPEGILMGFSLLFTDYVIHITCSPGITGTTVIRKAAYIEDLFSMDAVINILPSTTEEDAVRKIKSLVIFS